jgi:Fe-S cluster assembly ATPase SufC
MLHVTDVELVKDGKPILHDLNPQVREAEIRSILGVNGPARS